MNTYQSAILYFLAFILSLFLCEQTGVVKRKAISEKGGKISQVKRIKIATGIIISILPAVMIAALRADSVGADTGTYTLLFYDARKYASFWSFFRDCRNYEDAIFSIILYFCSHYLNNIYLFYGLMEFFALLPAVILGLQDCENGLCSQPLAVMLFFFYCDGLNAVRQYIAVAFVVLMITHLYKRQRKAAFACIVIAFGFHASAIYFAVIISILYYLIGSQLSKLIKVIVIGGISAILLFGNTLFVWLYDLGIVPSRWILYINTFIYGNSHTANRWLTISNMVYFEILARFCIAILLLFAKNGVNRAERKAYDTYLYMFILGIIIYAIGVFAYSTSFFVRITIYFDYFLLILLPGVDAATKIKVKFDNRTFKAPIFNMVCMLYWLIHAVVINSGRTMNYFLR